MGIPRATNEFSTKHDRMTERQISDGFCAFLRKEELSFVRARTDKKSGIQEGWPDVTVIHCGRAFLCELKTQAGQLSKKQIECHTELRKNGTLVTVARSVEEAVSAVQTWLGVEKPEIQPPERLDDGSGYRLWIASMGGVEFVFSGDSSPGGLATKLRRATPQDIRDLPRK